jgi:hypothetical protein
MPCGTSACYEHAVLRVLRAARVLSAIRAGSSLPVVVDTEDGARWIVKLRGAGGGDRALVCEAIYGALADAVGLPVPARAVDRTVKNPNVLVMPTREYVFIDHAALLVFEHAPDDESLGCDASVAASHLFAGAARFEAEVLRTTLGLSDRALDGAIAALPGDWLGPSLATQRAARSQMREVVRVRRERYLQWRAEARARFPDPMRP